MCYEKYNSLLFIKYYVLINSITFHLLESVVRGVEWVNKWFSRNKNSFLGNLILKIEFDALSIIRTIFESTFLWKTLKKDTYIMSVVADNASEIEAWKLFLKLKMTHSIWPTNDNVKY